MGESQMANDNVVPIRQSSVEQVIQQLVDSKDRIEHLVVCFQVKGKGTDVMASHLEIRDLCFHAIALTRKCEQFIGAPPQ